MVTGELIGMTEGRTDNRKLMKIMMIERGKDAVMKEVIGRKKEDRRKVILTSMLVYRLGIEVGMKREWKEEKRNESDPAEQGNMIMKKGRGEERRKMYRGKGEWWIQMMIALLRGKSHIPIEKFLVNGLVRKTGMEMRIMEGRMIGKEEIRRMDLQTRGNDARLRKLLKSAL